MFVSDTHLAKQPIKCFGQFYSMLMAPPTKHAEYVTFDRVDLEVGFEVQVM